MDAILPTVRHAGRTRVTVLFNPRSGAAAWSPADVMSEVEQVWGGGLDADVSYQISRSAEDGGEKAARAVADGTDVLLVAGGDGMVNTIGARLIGSSTALGVIPIGSGNGFARHFGIPLEPREAIRALAQAVPKAIDVGWANQRPFFVTCSLAWDAELVRQFERFPVRGILPYVLAGVYGLWEYQPQPFRATLDGGPERRFDEPLIFTAANLTQYGGGARIAPQAQADDGWLELAVVERRDLPSLLAGFGRLFLGTLDRLKEVQYFRFRKLHVLRERPAPLQLDGELVPEAQHVELRVRPAALKVLVPPGPADARGGDGRMIPV